VLESVLAIGADAYEELAQAGAFGSA